MPVCSSWVRASTNRATSSALWPTGWIRSACPPSITSSGRSHPTRRATSPWPAPGSPTVSICRRIPATSCGRTFSSKRLARSATIATRCSPRRPTAPRCSHPIASRPRLAAIDPGAHVNAPPTGAGRRHHLSVRGRRRRHGRFADPVERGRLRRPSRRTPHRHLLAQPRHRVLVAAGSSRRVRTRAPTAVDVVARTGHPAGRLVARRARDDGRRLAAPGGAPVAGPPAPLPASAPGTAISAPRWVLANHGSAIGFSTWRDLDVTRRRRRRPRAPELGRRVWNGGVTRCGPDRRSITDSGTPT